MNQYTMKQYQSDGSVTTTQVWTDGSDPSHDETFAMSAWGHVHVDSVPADAEPFGLGAWRRITVTYPED
jgi:hypothetical protein